MSLYARTLATTQVVGTTLVQSALLDAASFADSPLPTLLILQPSQLISLLPSLKLYAASRLVLQVSTSASHDHSQVLALRSSGLALIYSADAQQAAVNALVALRIAASGRGVVHFGEFESAVDMGFAGVTSDWVVSQTIVSPQTNGAALASSVAAAYASLPASHAASPFTYTGSASPSTLVVALGNTSAFASSLPSNAALISLNLYRPFTSAQIRELVPAGVQTVVVLEQAYRKTAKWSPLFLDVVGAFAESDDVAVPVILSGTLGQVVDAAAAVATIAGEFSSVCHFELHR